MNNTNIFFRSTVYGVLAMSVLLLIYSSILTLVSGYVYMIGQFVAFWYFITSLAVGFGIQIGLYTYLKYLVHGKKNVSGSMVAVSGTTSTVAMVSCCAHYLVNILPVLGATGFVSLAIQYQIEFFWIGIVANLIGIGYVLYKIKTVLYA